MSRLFGKLGLAISYFSVATVLAAITLVVLGWTTGALNPQRLEQIRAILQGQDLVAIELARRAAAGVVLEEQPSYEDVIQARALKLRQLELREEMLRQAVGTFDVERAQFTTTRQEFDQVKRTFDEQLASLETASQSSGEENARAIYENIKPAQARIQLLDMIDRGEIGAVVELLSAMPVNRQAKILGEFKNPDDEAKLSEILRLMREGVPETPVIEGAQEASNQLNNQRR